jgi:aldehyde:ferredoxin oxidoreductase
MNGGYMGKILFVDLSNGKFDDIQLDERMCKDFIGGYGIGARFLYTHQKGRVDALGPENIIGFLTGPLTGTPVPFGARYTVVGKSPLTETWGDSNSGGDFGPYMKFAGYDGVFLTGVSEKPVYLLINNGKVELKDATHIWGKDVYQTEDILKAEIGKGVRIASIGIAGEKTSLMAGIITDKGRAAARSGLGAVMGSKRLKAIAVIGSKEVPLANPEELLSLKKKYLAELKGYPVVDILRKFGWSANVAPAAYSGGTPVKNWAGVGERDFPNAEKISGLNVVKHNEKRYYCYRCPIGCGALMKEGRGEYKYEAGVHRPNYETLAAFGTLCLNDNLESIMMIIDICNRSGIDTISAGATVAFAIECYENGIITKEDTEGIELTWGNHKAIVSMTDKIAKREGFGAMLADGVRVAADRIGKEAHKFAFHVHGQELPMWDPKFLPSLGTAYMLDPTPGRHSQGGVGWAIEGGSGAPGIQLPALEKYNYTGKGKFERVLKNKRHIVNASGICEIGYYIVPTDYFFPSNETIPNFLNLVTGWELTRDEINTIGQRISVMRHVFNLREGLSPKDFILQGRPVGDPPLDQGPLSNITIDIDTLANEYLKAMDFDLETGKPSKDQLIDLGLYDVVKDLYK